MYFLESVAECALCQAIESHIAQDLNDQQSTDEEIEEVVNRVCKYFPVADEDKVSILYTNLNKNQANSNIHVFVFKVLDDDGNLQVKCRGHFQRTRR